MKLINTNAYISALRDLTMEGYEVSVKISGNSMFPFLVHQRDTICFIKPNRPLKRGDMVFFQRLDGDYVMHRIWKIKGKEYYIVGDAQTSVEGPIQEEQIFGLIVKVQRNGTWMDASCVQWKFYEKVWPAFLPVRYFLRKLRMFLKKFYGRRKD